MSFLFNTFLYDPLYNALVFITGVVPGANIGVAVVILTILVKVVILPIQHKQIKTQKKIRLIQQDLKDLQSKFKDDNQERARQQLELYKQHGINPFASFLPLLIQLPILMALYWVFFRGIPFTEDALYSFVSLPASIDFGFLGIELAERSLLLALIVGVTQYFQIKLAMPEMPKPKEGDKPSFGDDLARSMSTNMRYVMPVFIAVIAAGFPSVVSVYWVTSNIFMIGHEIFVKRKAVVATEQPNPQQT